MSITHTIEVTAEDIAAGSRRDPTMCPVARATMRALGRQDIRVGTAYVNIGDGFATLPERAELSVIRYDLGGIMKPFKFTIKEN